MDMVHSADGTPIAVDVAGHGPRLVLVAGAFSDRSHAAPLAVPMLIIDGAGSPTWSATACGRCACMS